MWLLATCPDLSIRNVKKAVELALKACELTQWKQWSCVATLGAMYAENGDFTKAIKYENQVMGMEGVTEKNRADAQQRIDLYKQQKPYRIVNL